MRIVLMILAICTLSACASIPPGYRVAGGVADGVSRDVAARLVCEGSHVQCETNGRLGDQVCRCP